MKAIFCSAVLFLVLCSGPTVQAQTPPAGLTGKTRTYYVAADEVNWDYAPSGRDEAMGHPFDDLEKGYTENGPRHIGRVYKKAIFREYTDQSFSTLKARGTEEQYLGLVGPIIRGEVGDTIKVVFKNKGSHPAIRMEFSIRRTPKAPTITTVLPARTRPMAPCLPAPHTFTPGWCRNAPAPAPTIPARCSGCTTRIATNFRTSPPVCSASS